MAAYSVGADGIVESCKNGGTTLATLVDTIVTLQQDRDGGWMFSGIEPLGQRVVEPRW